MPPPAKDVESPKPVHRKHFMFSIALSMHLIAVAGMLNAWNIKDVIACAILS
jgi:hypothetical protein